MYGIMGNCYKRREGTVTWTTLWITLFGTDCFAGLNIGFWVVIAAVLLLVLLMNLIFWGMKPKHLRK